MKGHVRESPDGEENTMDVKGTLKKIPKLEGERANLRGMKESDAEDLFEYYSNEKVYRYLDWYGPKSIQHAKEVIASWNKGFTENWILRFGIAERSTDALIGTIFLNNFESRRAEIGYELSEDFWGKGIMSEAMDKVLQVGFEELGLLRIQAFVCVENESSKNLLLKHNFKHEGSLRKYECHEVTGICKDMEVFGLIREEFEIIF